MNPLYNLKKNYSPISVPRLKEDEMKWFRDAKYGLFLHWGIYAILGRGEWAMYKERLSASEYAKLADRFDPQEFDAKVWAKMAKDAGMKYMVLTARHHDGFCMFDSKVSSFNSVNSAAKRDFVAEYVKACRDEGLKVGLYYSPMDWRFPGYFMPEIYHESALEMKEQCWGQLRELMTNYGKIDMLWFDGEWLAHGGNLEMLDWEKWYEKTEYSDKDLYLETGYFWESEKLVKMIRELQPGIAINNRGGWEGDFDVRERVVGEIRTDKPWDTNDCLARSWGWVPNMPIFSTRQCIKMLTDVVCRDGNLLLNVGPKPEGIIEKRQADRLLQVGEWVKEYGNSLYNTRGGPFIPGEWGGSTYSGNTIYVHITEWVEDTIKLPSIGNKIVSFSSMTSDKVEVKQTESFIEISVPLYARHPFDTIIVLELDSPVVFNGVKGGKEAAYGLADGL